MTRTAATVRFEDGPDPREAARLLADWGFLANPDLPDHPGPGYVLVALRQEPTLRHYDPEEVGYWETRGGRGTRASLTVTSPMPVEREFAWGEIRVVDRLGITNEWLTFGGRLQAAWVDGMIAAVFVSPAPMLRRGGHSQGWDRGADNLGAFFGRIMVAVDYAPGFEQRVASATPLARYAAFVADLLARYGRSQTMRIDDQPMYQLMVTEGSDLQREHPDDWAAGQDLLEASGLQGR